MLSSFRTGWVLLSLVLGTLFGAASAMAQGVPDRPEWGGTDRVLYSIGFSEFTPANSSTTYAQGGNPTGRYSTVPAGVFYATPHIPSGVLLTYFELDYCHTGGGNVSLQLFDCSFRGDDCGGIGSSQLNSLNGSTGCSFVSVDLTPANHTTDNNTRRLLLNAVTFSGTSENKIIGAYIGYKLQVSPAPASATFLDVPTGHPFFRFVEALVDAGITAGCGGNNYCVNSPITRGEMAVFLSVALGLHFPN